MVSMSAALSALRLSQATADLSGKVAIVVGGTSGIGEGIALRLAKAKADVLIVGRNKERGAEILQQMRQIQGGGSSSSCGFLACDVSLLANVKTACMEISSKRPKVDILVLSPGIASLAGRTETPEGLDVKLATHYYARITFVECLAPQLKASQDPRVLSVLSAGVHSTYRPYREDPDLKRLFSIKNAADAAGFYNDLAADFLSEAHSPVRFVHAAPGFVSTRWGTELPCVVRWLVRALQTAGRSTEDCAEFMCSALLGAWPNDGQKYYLMREDGGIAKPRPEHAEARDFVRAHTMEVLGRLLSQ